MDRDYEIGFGKPPKDKQFKAGVSGNPKGRPRASKNTATLFQELLSKKVILTEDGKKVKRTVAEAIVVRLGLLALSGDMKAISAILKQLQLIENKKDDWSKYPRVIITGADEIQE